MFSAGFALHCGERAADVVSSTAPHRDPVDATASVRAMDAGIATPVRDASSSTGPGGASNEAAAPEPSLLEPDSLDEPATVDEPDATTEPAAELSSVNQTEDSGVPTPPAQSIPSGVYSSDEVLLWGTLSPAACYLDAIAPVLDPNAAATGIDCGGPPASWRRSQMRVFIRPSDGRIVFSMSSPITTSIMVFNPDGDGTDEYPIDPHGNDGLISYDCQYEGYELQSLAMRPDTGQLVYGCGPRNCYGPDGCVYFDQSGQEYVVPSGYHLLYVGFDNAGLLINVDDAQLAVLDSEGDVTPLELPYTDAIRAHAGGFWLLYDEEGGEGLARWSVSPDGDAQLDGIYPSTPGSQRAFAATSELNWRGCVFDASGAVWCLAESTTDIQEDQIVRSTLDADAGEIVYNESTDPLVQIHISDLVTGP